MCYRFQHPSFTNGESISDDFYKQSLLTSSRDLKGSKQMPNLCGSELITKLLQKSSCNYLNITKLQLARMKLDFALQKQFDILRGLFPQIEFQVGEPDYDDGDIAGYYGNVNIEDLKDGFQSLFPIYRDSEPINENPIEEVKLEKPEDQLMDWDDVPVVEKTKTFPSCFEDDSMQVPIECTPKRSNNQRKKMKRPTRNFAKEMEDALMYLHKETVTEAEE